MNLIEEQIINIKPFTSMPQIKIFVIVIGDNCNCALESLGEQIYKNFDVCCININPMQHIEGIIKLDQVPTKNLAKEVQNALIDKNAEYIYLLDGEDKLPVNAFLEYVNCIVEENYPSFIYVDEAIQYTPDSRWLDYCIKPLPSKVAFLQSFFLGKAVLWKKELIVNILGMASGEFLDLLSRELFILALSQKHVPVKLTKILLLKQTNVQRLYRKNDVLTLLDKTVKLCTNWNGHIGYTSSYGVNRFELYSNQTNILAKTGFIIIENDLARALQLLSQLSISCSNNEIIIGVKAEHLEEFQIQAQLLNLNNVKIEKRKGTYANDLTELISILQSPYQIILSDMVQWVNRMNLERLVNSFQKPEVMLAVPQVATEGDNPVLVYAGAGINNLSLNGSYFKGRLQKAQGDQDLAWTNFEVSMLTPFCLAARKEIWKELLPVHQTVSTVQQFANEISFLCLRKNIICEYSAQSAVWVSQEANKYYKKDAETGKFREKDWKEEPRLSGNYWHVLSEYGDLIEKKEKEIPYLLRGYEQYLKEDFQAFGLEFVNDNKKKRVLVLTHELSLTGAPLVLVQAVKVLIEANFNVLIASPMDGPLRLTYLSMGLPVIIDPQLQHNFEYIKVAYDFDFVVVSTVVLWQCIEAFSETQIPVLWWVHDSRIGYENYLRYVLPETIGDNVFLYCGGDYAQKVITHYRPGYKASVLLYGVDDFSLQLPQTVDRRYWGIPEDKMVFANIGQIMKRKGQDILVKAIRSLPSDMLEKSVFVFVGKVIDRNIYKEVENLKREYPQNIIYIEQIPYDLLKEFYREINGVICSSIDDPLPAFVSEALLMSRLCICSKNTAFNSIITSGKNGYLFESGNETQLSDILCQVIGDVKGHKKMERGARSLYETTFAPELFARNFLKLISEKLL